MKRAIIIGALFAAAVAGATGHVSTRLRVIREGYRMGQLMNERRALEEEHRKLVVEESLLKTPERIEKIARERLGMVKPDPGQIRVIGRAEIAAR
jgi:cell division protein FtsL